MKKPRTMYPHCKHLDVNNYNSVSRCFFCRVRKVYVYARKSVISPYGHYSNFNCAPDCETIEGFSKDNHK